MCVPLAQGGREDYGGVVRVRKRRPARPGEEFLEALAVGREGSVPIGADEPGRDDAGADLAEARQRAFTAEEALRQLRLEADTRLADARDVIAREQRWRFELEQRLAGETPIDRPAIDENEHRQAAPETSAAGSVPVAHQGDPEPEVSEFGPPPTESASEPAATAAAAWPTPWIEGGEARTSGGRRRRLFGRRARA